MSDLHQKGGNSADTLWQQFMEKDELLEKLLQERADFWVEVKKSGDEEKEKAAIEKIDKELNPEIDKLAEEVKKLLKDFQEAKDVVGSASKEDLEIIDDELVEDSQ